jgi:hypothetical protein
MNVFCVRLENFQTSYFLSKQSNHVTEFGFLISSKSKEGLSVVFTSTSCVSSKSTNKGGAEEKG